MWPDGDFRENTELPPEPPDWVEAVEAVANVLEDIHNSLERTQQKVMREYRKAAGIACWPG